VCDEDHERSVPNGTSSFVDPTWLRLKRGRACSVFRIEQRQHHYLSAFHSLRSRELRSRLAILDVEGLCELPAEKTDKFASPRGSPQAEDRTLPHPRMRAEWCTKSNLPADDRDESFSTDPTSLAYRFMSASPRRADLTPGVRQRARTSVALA
jgi:hypothetical protein